MTDPMSQGMMLAIVDDYSRLAERAQRLVVPKPGTLLWAACSNSLREGDDRCRRPHQLGRAWAGHSGPVVSRPPAPRRERKRCRRRSRPRAADRRPHRGVEKRLQLRTHRHRRCGEGRRAIRRISTFSMVTAYLCGATATPLSADTDRHSTGFAPSPSWRRAQPALRSVACPLQATSIRE